MCSPRVAQATHCRLTNCSTKVETVCKYPSKQLARALPQLSASLYVFLSSAHSLTPSVYTSLLISILDTRCSRIHTPCMSKHQATPQHRRLNLIATIGRSSGTYVQQCCSVDSACVLQVRHSVAHSGRTGTPLPTLCNIPRLAILQPGASL